MTKYFNLEWSELPEELKEQKIDEYIEELDDKDMSRESVEEVIASHFPVYF